VVIKHPDIGPSHLLGCLQKLPAAYRQMPLRQLQGRRGLVNCQRLKRVVLEPRVIPRLGTDIHQDLRLLRPRTRALVSFVINVVGLGLYFGVTIKV